MEILTPKNQFICDKCNKTILKPADGYVQWLINEDNQYYGFKVVHYKTNSNLKLKNLCVFYLNDPESKNLPLSKFTGESGLALMLNLLNEKSIKDKSRILDINEFIKFIRRLHISYYEQVNNIYNLKYIKNERSTLFPENLKHLLECANV